MTVETIDLDGLNMEIAFDYQPPERQTWEHPGCEEEYEINSVIVAGVDIVSLLSDETIERIEAALARKADDYREMRLAA